jgi:hypothetical protein
MRGVVEVDEIREVVHAPPGDGNPADQALADGFKHLRLGPELRVTGHAGLGRRQSGKGGLRDSRVAIAAVDAQSSDMVLVRERNRLSQGAVLLREVGGAGQEHAYCQCGHYDGPGAPKHHPCDPVCAVRLANGFSGPLARIEQPGRNMPTSSPFTRTRPRFGAYALKKRRQGISVEGE